MKVQGCSWLRQEGQKTHEALGLGQNARPASALDCGAGLGRVTKAVLLPAVSGSMDQASSECVRFRVFVLGSGTRKATNPFMLLVEIDFGRRHRNKSEIFDLRQVDRRHPP